MNGLVRALFCVAFLALWSPPATGAEVVGSAWKLSRIVDVNNVRFHQRMLQQIARRNDSNRAAGTEGYTHTVAYILSWLRFAGYRVEIQQFEFPYFQELSPPLLQRTSPEAGPYPPNTPQGFYTVMYSGTGEMEGPLVPVDVVMPPGENPNTSTSGCEADDFAGFPAGAIALIQRGSCYTEEKARNARNAGASGVVFFNEGQVNRTDAYHATASQPEFSFPMVFASFDIGKELYELGLEQEVRVRIKTDVTNEVRTTQNILASSRRGDPAHKVIVGAHLDSVQEGPGINDNGSGVAAVLETAVKMALWGMKPRNKVVFAFWAAEELGLVGSSHYVNSLPKDQLDTISLCLNFDMIGSENWVRFVMDGDGSDTPEAGPPGSGFIEGVFGDYYRSRNMPFDPSALDGRSDYLPFLEAGIPIGGLGSGIDEIKTQEQAALYGGTPGMPYDSNYHTNRDTLRHISMPAEKGILEAMAYAVGYFAFNPLPQEELRKKGGYRSPSFNHRGPLLVK